jgi:hypothetical protein
MRRSLTISLVAAAGLLTACAGDQPSVQHAPGSTANPTKGAITPKTVSGRSNEASGTAREQEQTAATTPCGLVSKQQASAIVGERISKPREAAQGPTFV